MKKIGKLFLSAVCLLSMAACGEEEDEFSSKLDIAMITDYGDITDQSFNQATYEGCKTWAEANDAHFNYYKPASDSTADRSNSIIKAIGDGANVIVMPGYAFGSSIEEVFTNAEYTEIIKDVKFIALDVSAGDLGALADALPSNLYCAVYQEEICGYFAGYAAVAEGYTKLGFLGGMAVPAVVRYGQGFVQGCNDAAKDLSKTGVSVNYVYGGQFFGDADITAAMDVWYNGGTEVVFACGGGIYSSACEAAVKVGGKVIGVDVDQKGTIEKTYGTGLCVTSAMKGLAATVQTQLTACEEGKFVGGKIDNLGLVSKTDVESNYVQLPVATWSMTNFTVDNYKALVAKIYDNNTISNDISTFPVTPQITVNVEKNIH